MKNQAIYTFIHIVLLIFFWSCNDKGVDGGGIIVPPIEKFRTIDSEPDWSPDGKTIAYTHSGGQIWLLDLQSMTKTFLTDGFLPAWAPDGNSIAYVLNDDIHIIDTTTKQITRLTTWGSCFFPSWSPDGTKIAYDATANWPTVPVDSAGIWIMNIDGSRKKLVLKGREPDWSPDGAKFVYYGPPGTAIGTESQIWVAFIDGSNARQLTQLDVTNRDPSWSPDGSKISWGSYGAGADLSSGIWVMNADGSNQHQLTIGGGFPSWSPDNSQIVYYQTNADSVTGTLWIMNADGTNQRQLTKP